MSASATSDEPLGLPIFLCRRVEKVAARRGLSFEGALEALLGDFFGGEVLATGAEGDVLCCPMGDSHRVNREKEKEHE